MNRRRPLVSISLTLLAAVSAVQAATVANISESVPALKDGSRMPLADIEGAILVACQKRNFVCTVTAPGVITGKFTHNQHYNAEVTIPFSPEAYEIQYKNSVGMKYNAAKNKIAGDYNAWVEALAEHIDAHLEHALKRFKKDQKEKAGA